MFNRLKIIVIFAVASLIATTTTMASGGMASWYGGNFHGKRTASGEIYNMYNLTAAHMSLPFGSKVRVTNRKNKKSVVVKINDRGNFAKYGRVIDLSKKANQVIDCNLCTVSLKVLSRGDGKYRRR